MNLTWFPVLAAGPTQFIHHLSWSSDALTVLLYEALNSLLTEMSISNTAKKFQTPFQLFCGKEAKGGIWERGSKSCSCCWWTALELKRVEKPQVLALAGWCLLSSASRVRVLPRQQSWRDTWTQFSSEGMESKIVFISHAQLERLLCFKRFFQYK